MTLTLADESQFDLCAVCGAYALLDDLEGVICAPCLHDAMADSAIYDRCTVIEYLAQTGQWHPNSVKGRALVYAAQTYNELQECMLEIENRYTRSYGLRPDVESIYNTLMHQAEDADDTIQELAPANYRLNTPVSRLIQSYA